MAAGTCQTQPVNSGMSGLRGAAKRMAEARDPDFCPNGHPRTAENTYTSKRANGSVKTQCKPCIRAAQRKFDAKLTKEERRTRAMAFPSYAKSKDYQRKYRFQKMYGITVEGAREML